MGNNKQYTSHAKSVYWTQCFYNQLVCGLYIDIVLSNTCVFILHSQLPGYDITMILLFAEIHIIVN